AAFEIEVGVLRAEADVAVCREVPDAVRLDLGEERGDAVAVEQIHLVKTHLRRALDEFAPAEEEVVDAVDLMPRFDQPRDETRGDKTGRAGDDDLQSPSSIARVRAS